MNCLNINRNTIYRAKCLGIVTLKVLPTSCSHYNSEEKTLKFPISKMKLNRINASSLVQVFNKMFGGFLENDRFLKIFLPIYLEKFTHSFQSSTKCLPPLNGFAMVTDERSITFKCFKERNRGRNSL